MPAIISHEDILFIRQLERKLQQVKSDESAPDDFKNGKITLKTQTINALYHDAREIGVNAEHISYQYRILKNSKDKKARADAQAKINAHIKWRTDQTFEAFKYKLDRVALGLEADAEVPENAFADIWKQLQREYGLGGGVPQHHLGILQRLQYAFDIQKGTKSAKELHDEYHAARSRYYQLLRAKHEKKKLWTAPVENKLQYELGYENQRITNDIENKKEDQKLLTHGLFWAKVFATAQAFFIAGGTWGILGLWGLAAGWWMALSIPVVASLFLFVSRSNWLTINEEMGPLLKDLFFDPALAHLSYGKRLWYMVRRANIFDGVNTLKGTANLVAGSFLGILTFAGSMTLLSALPGLPLLGQFSLGVFGAGSLFVIGFSAVMALITTFVYFVINNIRQQQLNKNPKAIKESLERLEKLREITYTSKWNPFKRYGFNIAVGMTGVAGMLLGAAPDFFGISHSYFGLSTNFFGFLHASFMGIPYAGLITAGLVMMACYGIRSFYQFRTLGSTENLIVGKSGLDFKDLKGTGLDNLDVTGRNPPDYAAKPAREFSPGIGGWIARKAYEAVTYFFNMDPDRDNSQYVRVGNALGQGMPALKGAGSMGFSAIVMKFAFGAFAPAMPAGAIIFGVSMAIGVLAGIFAFWASYSANSAGLRVVKPVVTEKEMLERDKAAMQPTSKRNLEQTVYYHLGEDKAKTELYAESRVRHGDVYWGSGYFWGTQGYSKDDKLNAARNMTVKLDRWVDGSNVPEIDTEDKIGVTTLEEIEQRKAKRLNFLYDKEMVSGRNPLSQGELGDIANDVNYLIGGKALDVYNRSRGDDAAKLERMESRRIS